ncbi:MAG TPA: ABC transporter substrate-binding protein, partial [Clostridiales bacterium UBA8960]|nr:ABC transporter substrate-binding protein [Clostridiales bacterium UBA8960]
MKKKNQIMIMILIMSLLVTGIIVVLAKNKNPLGFKRIVIGRMNDALSLDPAITSDSESFQVTANIYDTLVVYKTNETEIKPGLAESWKVSEDGLTWNFKIRRNVKFHDGSKLDAHVVAFNFQRWMDPSSPYHTGQFIYWNYTFGGFPGIIKSVTALSDTTLEIILTEPYAPFLSTISLPAFGIASQSAIVKYNDNLKFHPVGTGPYIFTSWESNESIVLKRNDDYWGEHGKSSEIEFRVLPPG